MVTLYFSADYNSVSISFFYVLLFFYLYLLPMSLSQYLLFYYTSFEGFILVLHESLKKTKRRGKKRCSWNEGYCFSIHDHMFVMYDIFIGF